MSGGRLIDLLVIGAFALSACSSNSSHAFAPSTSPNATTTPASTATSSSNTPPPTAGGTSAPVTTGPVAATSGSCYIGSWTSTNYVQVGQGISTNGGAGIHLSISASQMSFDFTGMQPVNLTGPISGQGLYTGTEEAPVAFSPSGAFTVLAKATSNVTFESKLASAASYGTPISANSFPSGGITGTYNCSGSTLSLKVPTPQGPTTLTFTRS